MLGSYWLFLTGLLVIISVILHQVPLLLISLLFFLAGAVARLWQRYCLARVDYQRRLSNNHVFFGEEIHLETEITNRKPLPLPWIQIDDEIPEEVTLLKGTVSSSHKANRVVISSFLPLNWYHKVKRRYPIRCSQRGCFVFGPARIRSGDLFGFFNRETVINQVEYLTVYPRIVPLEKLGIPSKQPLGDIRIRNHLFHDPLLTLGVRNYHFGDSLKQVHWKSTARLGQLQTRVFEPTTTIDMGIFLDIRTLPLPLWGSVPRLLELAIITAASIANHAITARYRVGLYVNQNRRFSNEAVNRQPSRHADQLRQILESLAQIQSVGETMPIARMVQYQGRNLPWGSTLVVISAVPTDALFSTLLSMKRAGRRVVLVQVGGSKPELNRDGLTVYHVKDDVMWHDLETLSVEDGTLTHYPTGVQTGDTRS